MRIVKILGGLGNQMFQYAFSRELEKRSGEPVLLDLSSYEGYGLHHGYELERVFGIQAACAGLEDVDRLATRPLGLFSRARRKYFTKPSHFIDRYFGYYDKVFSRTGDTYYDGYWQSEKYFSSVRNDMRAAFSFSGGLGHDNEEALAALPPPRLSVHVRRGDYLKSVNQSVCGKDYYLRALDAALSSGGVASVVFLSDDPAWCRENLSGVSLPVAYVDWNRGQDSWRDMAIMSRCDHNVIANSSFSWWGAWLNPNPQKRVYAPAIWNRRQVATSDRYYSFTFDDIVPASWIRIQNDV